MDVVLDGYVVQLSFLFLMFPNFRYTYGIPHRIGCEVEVQFEEPNRLFIFPYFP